MATYKLYSFDYFDSILVSGKHEEKSIRCFENLRKTKKKEVYYCGCSYYDYLLGSNQPQYSDDKQKKTILIAPTWGKNGLLVRFGEELISHLLSHEYHLIIRPHPQAFISEIKMIEELIEKYARNSNVEFDRRIDTMYSINKSNILISDVSGFILDYLFIGSKPIIVFSSEFDKSGLEANDLPYEPWEFSILEEVAMIVSKKDIPQMHKVIDSAHATHAKNQSFIVEERDKNLVNFGSAASSIVDVLSDKSKGS